MILFPYADENPRPEDRDPIIVLILVNMVAFAMFHTIEDYLRWGFVPAEPSPERWITSQFLHGGLIHLLGNMWALWIFGDNVAARLKRLFLPFYLAGGVAAAGLHFLLDPRSRIPAIGASGAICAVIGAYAVLFPTARLRCFTVMIWGSSAARQAAREYGRIQYFTVSALLWAGFYTTAQIFSASWSGQGSGVAYGAHIGGLLFGALVGICLRAQMDDDAVALSGPCGEAPDSAVDTSDIEEALAGGDEVLAASLFVQASRRDPYLQLGDGSAQLRMADLLCAQGQGHLARLALERFLSRRPQDELAASALTLLGYVEQTQFKEFASALARYEAAAAHPRATPAQRADALKRVAETRALLQNNLIDPEGLEQPCALLLETAPPLSQAGLKTVEALIDTRPDPCSGFLARLLPGPEAMRAASALERAGVHVVVVPESRLWKAPSARITERPSCDAGGLHLSFTNGPRIDIAWSDCLLIAAFRVHPEGPGPEAPGVLDIGVGGEIELEEERLAGEKKTPCLEVTLLDHTRYHWLADNEAVFFSTLREIVAQAPQVPVDYGARSAYLGRLPDAVVFDGVAKAEAYLSWQTQLARLKREKNYA